MHEIHVDLDTYAVAIRLDCITPRMIESSKAWTPPVIDEQVMLGVEREAEEEAQDNWVQHDHKLVSALNEDDDYATEEAHDCRDAFLRRECLEDASTTWRISDP